MIDSASEGKTIIMFNNVSSEERVLINNLVQFIMASQYEEEELELDNPVDVITVTYCDIQFISLLYLKG